MIQDPNTRRLRRLDIGLLVVFHEVMAHGDLRAAAGELAVTQSAVSHAVRRLSNILGFQLFVRRREMVTPTQRAIDIAPAVALIIATALGLLATAAQPEEDSNARLS